MSSHSRRLYIGVTTDLHGRVWEHKNGIYEGFSKKYQTHHLIYQEFSMTSNRTSPGKSN